MSGRFPLRGGNPPPQQGGYLQQGGYSQQGGYPQQGGYAEQPRAPPRSQDGGRGGQSGGRQIPLRVEKLGDKSLQARFIYGNLCAVSPEDFPPTRGQNDLYILLRAGQPVGEYVVTAEAVPGFPRGCISLSDPQRTWCGIALRDTFSGEIYNPFQGGKEYLGSLDVEIGFASANKKTTVPYDEDELSKMFIATCGNQVLSPGQRILMDVRNIPLLIIVKTVGLVDLTDEAGKQTHREPHARGVLTNQTRVLFHQDGKTDFQLKPSMSKPNSNAIFAPGFKFEDMGIGGLHEEFATIFRRAFASRIFPPGLIAQLGIPHVKGMLLYGPPGTGKTLIARQIGKMLNARPPKVINGPEVLNKYVGQSEENIRKLFADAEKEYKEKGEESGLHIIIFDELDAVCKQRGSGAGGGTGVGDSVVNQLLSKLDGVDQLNNILLIGMTNRKDMIDDALLRPGRLEVHVEISLPNEEGRLEILKIHTAKMSTNGLLDHDVRLEDLAELTKNYSGAEISGLVKAAASFAISRHTEVAEMAAVKQDANTMKVNSEDFAKALAEVRPAYGVSEDELKKAVRLGIIPYSPRIENIFRKVKPVVNMIKKNTNETTSSVLFYGLEECGKTALAAHIALESGLPFVKLVTPGDLVGYGNENAKREFIHRAFMDAYKSPSSILILDDFERMIEWSDIGPRYSNTMLQALITLIHASPPKGHRLLVFVTTSQLSVLKMLGINRKFHNTVEVPAISNLNELGFALQDLPVFDSSKVNQSLGMLQERIGSNNVNIGIKTVLRCIDQASRAEEEGEDFVQAFTDFVMSNTGTEVDDM